MDGCWQYLSKDTATAAFEFQATKVGCVRASRGGGGDGPSSQFKPCCNRQTQKHARAHTHTYTQIHTAKQSHAARLRDHAEGTRVFPVCREGCGTGAVPASLHPECLTTFTWSRWQPLPHRSKYKRVGSCKTPREGKNNGENPGTKRTAAHRRPMLCSGMKARNHDIIECRP